MRCLEIATIAGHSLRTVQEIHDKHYLNRDVGLGYNTIIKLEASEGAVKTIGLSVIERGGVLVFKGTSRNMQIRASNAGKPTRADLIRRENTPVPKRKKKGKKTPLEVGDDQAAARIAKLKMKAELQAASVDPDKVEAHRVAITEKLSARMKGVVVEKKGKAKG